MDKPGIFKFNSHLLWMTHYIVSRRGRVVYAGSDWGPVIEALPPYSSNEFSMICTEEKDGSAIRTYLTDVWVDAECIKFKNKTQESLPLNLTKN